VEPVQDICATHGPKSAGRIRIDRAEWPVNMNLLAIRTMSGSSAVSSRSPTETSPATSAPVLHKLGAEKKTRLADLAELQRSQPVPHRPELLGPAAYRPPDLTKAPEKLLRALFEAFRLQIHYDKRTNTATCRITIAGEAIDTQQQAGRGERGVGVHPGRWPVGGDLAGDVGERFAALAVDAQETGCPVEINGMQVMQQLVHAGARRARRPPDRVTGPDDRRHRSARQSLFALLETHETSVPQPRCHHDRHPHKPLIGRPCRKQRGYRRPP
jgi:hypothetical protein